MEAKDKILDLVEAKTNRAIEKYRRCVILQPGAVGDCILSLPLVDFIKKKLKIGSVDMIARTDYTGYFPGRTSIDSIRSLDSVDTYRLFTPKGDFKFEEMGTLIDLFAGYSYIISFMGDADSDFEQNLIFTVNCSNSAEVIILNQIDQSDQAKHISQRHIKNFLDQYNAEIFDSGFSLDNQLVNVMHTDITTGRKILNSYGIDSSRDLIVIHPGSGSINKSWHLSNFLTLNTELKKINKQVIFLLGLAELERFSKPQLSAIEDASVVIKDISLNQVLQVLSCCNYFIGNDSGITHLAAGIGTKTIALFGPTDSNIYRPIGPDVTVIEDKSENFTQTPSPDIQQKVLEIIKK